MQHLKFIKYFLILLIAAFGVICADHAHNHAGTITTSFSDDDRNDWARCKWKL